MIQTTPHSTGALWARFRFSVVGSLLSSPPARGALKTAIHGSYKRAGIDEEACQRAARETPQAAQRNLGAVMLCELSCAVFPGIKGLLACEDREKPVMIWKNKLSAAFDGIEPGTGPGNQCGRGDTASSSSLA